MKYNTADVVEYWCCRDERKLPFFYTLWEWTGVAPVTLNGNYWFKYQFWIIGSASQRFDVYLRTVGL